MKLVIASRYTGQLSIDAQLASDRAIRATLLPGQTIDVSNIATPDELNRDEGISRTTGTFASLGAAPIVGTNTGSRAWQS